eukprot:CAMPEP_0194034322 /NCGR_PEP_ID=MMETSP0009_2-20130614/6728_1 /TAXON_ID=210454 /ORGANISM="Grammatophora oceanica, Strain CCMP 410" /LENGTH=83 /DNA_ID=CAMNT_0038675181 /DNA_START=306 /DNA_END=554 /DNA_ORIENTATION=-
MTPEDFPEYRRRSDATVRTLTGVAGSLASCDGSEEDEEPVMLGDDDRLDMNGIFIREGEAKVSVGCSRMLATVSKRIRIRFQK